MEPNDPTEAIEQTDPADPMLSVESTEPTDRNELRDHNDSQDVMNDISTRTAKAALWSP